MVSGFDFDLPALSEDSTASAVRCLPASCKMKRITISEMTAVERKARNAVENAFETLNNTARKDSKKRFKCESCVHTCMQYLKLDFERYSQCLCYQIANLIVQFS